MNATEARIKTQEYATERVYNYIDTQIKNGVVYAEIKIVDFRDDIIKCLQDDGYKVIDIYNGYVNISW